MQKLKPSTAANQQFVLLFIIAVVLGFALKIIEMRVKDIHRRMEDLNSDQNQIIQMLIGSKLETFTSLLKVYEAKDENGSIKLKRLGKDNDGGYIAPEKSLAQAEVLFGYGIDDDISFEEAFSNIYNKPSFGFDCGIESIKSQSKLFTFVNECIASDNFLYSRQKSSYKISSFTEQIKSLNLSNKKIFIKMDIEGAEYDALEDIIKNPHNVTGIVFEMHIFKKHIDFDKAIKLLTALQKDFVLVHLHGLNCHGSFETKNATGSIPYQIEFTYINKSLVTDYQISKNQSHPTDLDMPNCTYKPEARFTILAG